MNDDFTGILYLWGDDCPNCEHFAQYKREFVELLQQRSLSFESVNVYKQMDVARSYGIFGIPAFLFFKEGKLLGRISGFHGTSKMIAAVDEFLGSPISPI